MGKQIINVLTVVRSGILTAAGTAAIANSGRISYLIQNLGTNPLFVKEGAAASTSDFDYILAAGTLADDGTGALHESSSSNCYQGIITVAGTSPRFTITQRQEF